MSPHIPTCTHACTNALTHNCPPPAGHGQRGHCARREQHQPGRRAGYAARRLLGDAPHRPITVRAICLCVVRAGVLIRIFVFHPNINVKKRRNCNVAAAALSSLSLSSRLPVKVTVQQSSTASTHRILMTRTNFMSLIFRQAHTAEPWGSNRLASDVL